MIKLDMQIERKEIIDKDILKALQIKGSKQCEIDYDIHISSET